MKVEKMRSSIFHTLTLLFLVSCGEPVTTTHPEEKNFSPELSVENEKHNSKFRQNLLAEFDTVILNQVTYYIVEGDLLLTESDCRKYLISKDWSFESDFAMQDSYKSSTLRIQKFGSEIIKQKDPSNITYSVIRKTFKTDEGYKNIVDYMNEATRNWAAVCNVKFHHKAELDEVLNAGDNPNDLTFVVVKGRSIGNLLATAFFPNDPKEKRQLIITPKFFDNKFSKTGILRHEIGHILGFWHENSDPLAPAHCRSDEEGSYYKITEYDSVSVMHYFCGDGYGTMNFKISQKDSIGASQMYPFDQP